MHITKEYNNDITNLCAENCITGFAPVNNTQYCDACDSICATCSKARNASTCTSCASGYYFNDNETICIECASGTAKNPLTNKCEDACSSGYYADTTDR